MTQTRLARVGDALARWDTTDTRAGLADLQQVEKNLVYLLSRLALHWERRN